MASVIYNSFVRDLVTGAIDLDTDSFKMMLVTSAYTPDKDVHDRRNDITNEVSGTGYTAGGAAITLTVAAVDTANDDVEVTLGSVTWTTATISAARYGIVYKSRGGASSADELCFAVDFGADISSTAANFTFTPSGTLKFQN